MGALSPPQLTGVSGKRHKLLVGFGWSPSRKRVLMRFGLEGTYVVTTNLVF